MFTLEIAQSWMRRYAQLLSEQKEYLTELDSPIGDGDHGTNMARGMNAAVEEDSLNQADLGALFKKVGMTLVSRVGGTSGPLYGTFFLRAAKQAGAATELSVEDLSQALRAGLAGVIDRGKAELADKTMVDAISPALDAFDQVVSSGGDLAQAAQAAASAATQGAQATTDMLAKKGRASYLGQRSIGHQDPGATSSQYLFQTLSETVQ